MRLDKRLVSVKRRNRSRKLRTHVADVLHVGEAALEVEGEADSGVHVAAAHIGQQPDDERKHAADDERVAYNKDAHEEEEGAEKLADEGKNVFHIYLEALKFEGRNSPTTSKKEWHSVVSTRKSQI